MNALLILLFYLASMMNTFGIVTLSIAAMCFIAEPNVELGRFLGVA